MHSSSATRLLFCAAWFALGGAMLVAQNARDRAVELGATVRQTPPRITLRWNAPGASPVIEQKVYRRSKGSAPWVELASLPASTRSFADNAVSAGASYEYFVYRVYDGLPGTASGWLSAGIRAPLIAERGNVILLVDDTMSAPLGAELAQFTNDLVGDGWNVLRQDISRTASVTSVRATVQSLYNLDPADTVALILFGHIPVPYSGDFSADGHADHFGAWPTDAYYGDVDGTWTDSTVNDTGAGQARNQNIPGDGKFDQSVIPSDVELEVGRIDLAAMPGFGASETELLRQYLVRDHQYRHRLGAFAAIPRRGLIDDHFGFFAGEAFAATAWRGFSALFGSANVRAADWFATLQTQKYLCAYGCGAGGYNSANGIGTTGNFATFKSLAVFNFLFGSYFGDWDSQDNFLRAPLAGTAASFGLVSCWVGRPHWFFHPMGLGETVGYCARLSQNNTASFPAGYEANDSERYVHIALIGDPTLRLHPVKPPSNLVATPGPNAVTLRWKASGDSAVEGYLVSRATAPLGPFVRVRTAPVAGGSYVDRTVTPGVSYTYLVRAVKRETTASGTYRNPSQGIFSAPVAATTGTGPEINLVGNGNAIANGDTLPQPANGTDFGAVEVGQPAVTRTFTMKNPGTASLAISSVQLSGTNAANFLVVNPPGTVAAGGNTTFDVRFQPAAIGARTAKLTLRNNDASEAVFAVALGGTGVPAHSVLGTSPSSITVSLHAGETFQGAVHVSNPGPGTLTYTISNSLDTYRFRDSDSFGGPAYNWVEISGSGTEIKDWPGLDDSATGAIALGFAFPFYGSSFDNLRVCTNGYLAPLDIITLGQNGPLPNSSAPASMIAPFWSDLVIDGSSHVFWQNVSGNFVVQYENVSLLGDGARRITCEVILEPAGGIVFQYKELIGIGNSYTIGIQNGRCDDGLLIAYGTSYLHPDLAIRIAPPGAASWLALGANPGTVGPGGSLQIPITLDATGLAPGDYFASMTITSNAAGAAPVVIPIQLTVN